MERNLTKDSPVKLLTFFALPVFLGNIFQIIYNLVDMAIVGRYVGVGALAAVGAVGSLMFCLTGAATGLANGFGILIARYYGAKDDSALKQHTAMSIWLCIIIGFFLSVFCIAGLKGFLRIMKTPEDIYEDAYAYLFVIVAGFMATIIYNMFACMLRAVGDSKTPLYFLILSSVLNIVFDLTAVVVFKMGVTGAALATVAAQIVSALLCLIVIRKKYSLLCIERRYWRFSGFIAGELLKMGIPMALQFSVCSVGVMIVQTAMNEMGSTVVAGYAVAGKLAGFTEQPFSAIGTALAIYVGQNYGAKEYRRIHQGVWAGLGLSAVCAVILFALSMTVIAPASAFFVGKEETEVIAVSMQYFHLIAWFYPVLGIIFVYRNALQGIGDGFVPMLASVMELLARGGIILVVGTSLGFTGAAMANPLAWVAATLPLIPVFYYRMRRLS